MIKCIVCDLDGTLIRKDDTMDERNAKLIEYYAQRGVEFIIATGRDKNMVSEIVKNYDIDCDLVLNNGTEYTNVKGTFKDIYPMDPDGFCKIVKVLKEYDYAIEIFTDQGLYGLYDRDTFWKMHEKMLYEAIGYVGKLPYKVFTVQDLFMRHYHQVNTPEEVLKEAKPLKIDARHTKDDSISTVRQRLAPIMNLNISSSHDHNIEITGTLTNKGDTLKRIMKAKGIKDDEVAVFGDGENDIPMMKAFKYAVAPSNANEHVKQIAYYITETDCDNGAVYEGIKKLEADGLL